jgi:hypothetical protein
MLSAAELDELSDAEEAVEASPVASTMEEFVAGWHLAAVDPRHQSAIDSVRVTSASRSRADIPGVPRGRLTGGVNSTAWDGAAALKVLSELHKPAFDFLKDNIWSWVQRGEPVGGDTPVPQKALQDVVVSVYSRYFVGSEEDRFFPLDNLRPTKEHASLSTQLLSKLSFRFTQVRSANRILVKCILPICTRQLSYLQPPKMRPTAVLDYAAEEPGGPSTDEYPVDILCILRVKTVGNEDGGEVPDDVEKDVALCQWYEMDPRGDHPLVPSARYVYLGETMALVEPSQLKRPALLIPHLNPNPQQRRGVSRGRFGVPATMPNRPRFFWQPNIL